jgi:hypothetical protein
MKQSKSKVPPLVYVAWARNVMLRATNQNISRLSSLIIRGRYEVRFCRMTNLVCDDAMGLSAIQQQR